MLRGVARKEGFELDRVKKHRKNRTKLCVILFALSQYSVDSVQLRIAWLFWVKGKNKGKLFARKSDCT